MKTVSVRVTQAEIVNANQTRNVEYLALCKLREAGAPVVGTFYPKIATGTLRTSYDLTSGDITCTWTEV